MLSKVYVRDPQYNMYLVPQTTSFKRMEMSFLSELAT